MQIYPERTKTQRPQKQEEDQQRPSCKKKQNYSMTAFSSPPLPADHLPSTLRLSLEVGEQELRVARQASVTNHRNHGFKRMHSKGMAFPPFWFPESLKPSCMPLNHGRKGGKKRRRKKTKRERKLRKLPLTLLGPEHLLSSPACFSQQPHC